MENKNILGIVLLTFIVFNLITPLILAQEEKEVYSIRGFEIEKIIYLVIGIICLILFIIAFMAYHRDKRSRYLFVEFAFLLFSIKGFLISSELFIPEMEWVDPVSVILEFVALLSLFYGVLKK